VDCCRLGGEATLLAVDGSTTDHVASQLGCLPQQATHLVFSVAGDNALMHLGILDAPVLWSNPNDLTTWAKRSGSEIQRSKDVVLSFDFVLAGDGGRRRCATPGHAN
jgi:hypothetical protein